MNDELEAQARRMRDAMVEEAKRRADEWLRGTLVALGQMPPAQAPHAPESDASGEQPVQRGPAMDLDKNASLIENLRCVIRSLGPRVFTTIDVLDAVSHVYNTDDPIKRSTISTSLKKLARTYGELEVVRLGKGSSPTKYRAVHPNSRADGETP